MKYPLIFLLMLLLVSCNYFDVKKTSSEAILNEELKTFNWNDVDTYPSFSSCDSLNSKVEKKQCFEYTLSSHILKYLQDEIIVVTQDVNDTIGLHFKVSETGVLTLVETKIDSLTLKEIPNILELIKISLDSLPEVFPGIKRGQQVKTEFKLPIIISVE
ncbi:hypothetical protein [Seonamhaeicola maritimus]|uniref:TonB C-terminal domain-containing protein n=1 Tax=Seonamhaeicola maritimus TaxID=2591822 RepID=A0A5C7GHQ0_9FLAO|nr:hypothetical protein [Seonamhaeicola maritimus]TXG36735.1 hypothetical protein FUA22_09135 [Seonamhaeicola maritimus]